MKNGTIDMDIDENGEELLEAVEDDEIADAVFNIVMERAEAEEE